MQVFGVLRLEMASPRAPAPAASAACLALVAGVKAAAASARAARRVAESAALLSLQHVLVSLARQLEEGDVGMHDPAEERELRMREDMSRPDFVIMRARLRGATSDGAARARRNIGQHASLGCGAGQQAQLALNPQGAQRGGR